MSLYRFARLKSRAWDKGEELLFEMKTGCETLFRMPLSLAQLFKGRSVLCCSLNILRHSQDFIYCRCPLQNLLNAILS